MEAVGSHIICIYKTAKTVYNVYIYIYINGIYINGIYEYLYIYIYSLYNPKNHCFFFRQIVKAARKIRWKLQEAQGLGSQNVEGSEPDGQRGREKPFLVFFFGETSPVVSQNTIRYM